MTTRNTVQRRLIWEVLRNSSAPLTIEQIIAEVHTMLPTIGSSTVYRAMKQFLDEGKLVSVNLPGQTNRYEVSGKGHHHHFHCRSCDHLFEVPGCSRDINCLVPHGFEVEGHELVFKGICSECRTEASHAQ